MVSGWLAWSSGGKTDGMMRWRLMGIALLASFSLTTNLQIVEANTSSSDGANNASNAIGNIGSASSGDIAHAPSQGGPPASLATGLGVVQRLSLALAAALDGHAVNAILVTTARTAVAVQSAPATGGNPSQTGATTGEPTTPSTGRGSASGTPAAPVPTFSPTTYYLDKNGVLYKHDASGFVYVVGPAASFMQSGQSYFAHGNQFYVRQGNGFSYLGTFENPYRQLDLRLPASLTASQVAQYIRSNDSLSPLIALAPIYLQAQQQYGVNAQYLVAHSIIESTWGSSQIAHDKNNLFGYSAFDSSPYASAAIFPSKAYAILYEAWYVRKDYLEPTGPYFHGPTLDGMNVDYATDPNWAESIAAVMWNMAPYNAVQYQQSQALAEAAQPPVFPYPTGLSGTVTTTGLNVRAGPGTDYAVMGQLNTGASVPLTGWVPGWYRAMVNGQPAFLSSQYVRVNNLSEITGDNVNVRAAPQINAKVVAQLQYANQVELLGSPVNKSWQHITTMEDVTGYVYSAFATPLH